MDIPGLDKGDWSFGTFRLDAARRELTRGGAVVKLTSRQFDALLCFVTNPGRIIPKDELMAAIWPGRVVEESSLTQTIHLVRRALQADEAERYIVTAPGRGYRFVAEVRRLVAGADTIGGSVGVLPAAPTRFASTNAAQPGRAARWRFPGRLLAAAYGAAIVLALVMVTVSLSQGEHAYKRHMETPFAPPPHSVAVLAFTNMSGDPAREYFSEGLSEELINTLSRVNALQVAARTSSFSFKDGKAAIGEIGRKLNVRSVLEGSVRANGSRLRVTAQLIDASTGYQLWSHTYDRDKGDVLQLETDIAEAVAQSLEVTLLGAEKTNLTAGGTSNALAFDAYLRGANLIRTVDEPSIKAALSAFGEASRLDPDFADAHAGRAFALVLLGFAWPADPTPRRIELGNALREADRAIDLAPQSARAHATRAAVLEWRLDLRGAEAEAVKAHALDSGDVMVERVYARTEAHHGNFVEAIAAAQRLVALDPLSAAQYYQLAGILVSSHDYKGALNALRREQAIGTVAVLMTHEMMAEAHLGLGDAPAALRDCANLCDPEYLDDIAVADMRLGLVAQAKAALAKMQSRLGDSGAYQFAGVYAQWGDTNSALHWLNVAFARGSSDLCQMRIDLFFDPIRNTPRFLEIERKLGFPPRTS